MRRKSCKKWVERLGRTALGGGTAGIKALQQECSIWEKAGESLKSF